MLRGDLLSQITHDDTYVQYLVDEGRLTPDEAKDHPRKSVILRALLGTDVEPDVSIREVTPKLAAQGLFPVAICGAAHAAFTQKQYDDYGRAIRQTRGAKAPALWVARGRGPASPIKSGTAPLDRCHRIALRVAPGRPRI